MTEKDDGGPAFPFAATDPSNVQLQTSGMTLRDYFAAHALANLYAQHEDSPDKVAEWAFEIADAMLGARRS